MNRYLLTLILTLFISTTFAEHSKALDAEETIEQKSVGVVMSGGGAKGLYHIGVLEALEESGVPIDYVAGTSMGAIIAGLYAAGYSPDEMRKLALSGELEQWVSGRIDANYGSLFRRGSTLRNNDPTVTLRINTDEKDSDKSKDKKIPKSLISTTQIDMAISELFTPASVAAKDDFNELMVPFLCVASDVAGNKKVVFTDGDLGLAIRASMAIPIAFSPVMTQTGEVLYDGGIQDNFPWKSMQEHFNPDIIVGSVCGVDSWTNTDDLSLFDQAFLLSMNRTDYNLPEEGVLIAHDVPIGMLDFSDPAKAMNLGYWDTKQKVPQIIERLDGVKPLSSDFYAERRDEFKSRSPELIFDSYDITGLNHHQKEYVERYMMSTNRQQKFGATREREMDFPHLKRSLFSVMSTGEYTTNFPIVTYDEMKERYNFSIELEHKPSLELSLGGKLSSSPFNQIYLGAKYTTIERIGRTLFGELYLGPVYNTGRLGYRVDFYHNAPIFIDTYFNFAVKNLNHGDFGYLTEVTNTMGVKSSEYLMSLGIGLPIMQRSQIILRGNAGAEQYNYNGLEKEEYYSNQYLFTKSRFKYMAGKVEIERSTIDDLYLPNQGSLLSLSAIGVLGKESSYANEYDETQMNTLLPLREDVKFSAERLWVGMKVNFIKYFNLATKQRVTLGIDLDATYTTIPKMYSEAGRQLLMPAYQPISHMQMVYMPEYSAPRYLGFGVIPSVKLWRELSLRLEAYSFARDHMDDESAAIDRNSTLEFEYIMQSSFIYNTPFGPISLSATKYNIDSWNNLYLTFNFGFTIFASRGTFY